MIRTEEFTGDTTPRDRNACLFVWQRRGADRFADQSSAVPAQGAGDRIGGIGARKADAERNRDISVLVKKVRCTHGLEPGLPSAPLKINQGPLPAGLPIVRARMKTFSSVTFDERKQGKPALTQIREFGRLEQKSASSDQSTRESVGHEPRRDSGWIESTSKTITSRFLLRLNCLLFF